MSGKRRAGGPVRQLSLQQSARRQPLRRQVSEDRSYWDQGLRVLASSIVSPGNLGERPRREAQPVVVRPRPVRIAWSERRQVSCEGDVSVGVVVQRCKGLPRPVTAKPARPSAQPDSILYSRQQLAERLRLAWKDRQERPNLDIFLAHNSFDRTEDEVLSVREIRTEVERTALKSSEETVHTFTSLSNKVNNPSDIFVESFHQSRDGPPERHHFTTAVHTFPTATFPLAAFEESSESDRVAERPKQTPSITISFDHGADSEPTNNDADEETPSNESKSAENSNHLLKPDIYTPVEVKVEGSSDEESEKSDPLKERDKPKQESLTATMRRANFRNSNNNPVMSGTPPATPTTPSVRQVLKKPPPQPLTRMMSAPVAGRSASARGTFRPDPRAEADADYDEDDATIVQRERIKSAPARRKFKGRRKGPKGHEDDSSEDEICLEEPPSTSKPRNRKRFVERATDIVTMVSLLSPNESEAEDVPEPVIQLPQDPTWGKEVRYETKEAESKTNHLTQNNNNTPGIVSLRKFPVKTVSFQQPGAGRSYTASYPSRRGVGTALILPPPPTPPVLSTAPPPPTRRRLVKAKSAGQLGQENSCDSEPPPESPPALVPPPPPAPITPIVEHEAESDTDPNAEPAFKTAKERECWQMFRKMVDKGVTVSYDTVLRGMLTPTEYRLHKKSVSSTC